MMLLFACLLAYPDSAVVIAQIRVGGGLQRSTARTIARDARGRIHVAFAYDIALPRGDSAQVFYTFSDDGGATWAPLENVSRSDSLTVWPPTLTVDSVGTVHCVWNQFWVDSTGGYHWDFFYSCRESGAWVPPVNVSRRGSNTNVFNDAGIVLDRLGRPHVVFHWGYNPSRYDGAIYHCYKDGDTWTRPFCLTPEPIWENLYPSLAVDRQGRLHVAWMLYEWGSNRDTIYYARYDTAWGPPEVVYATGIAAGAPCIAVDSSDTPWIAFIAGPFGDANDAYCAHRDSTGWHYTNVSNSPEWCYEAGITIDSNDCIYFVWSEFVPARDILSRTYDGRAWSAIQNLTADSGFASYAPQLSFPVGERVDLAWTSRDTAFRTNEVVYMSLTRVVSGVGEPGRIRSKPASEAMVNPIRRRELAAVRKSGRLYGISGRVVRDDGGSGSLVGLMPAGIYFYRPDSMGETRKLVILN